MSTDAEEIIPGPLTLGAAPESMPDLEGHGHHMPALSAEPAVLRRQVLGLAWPVIGENLLETLLGIVDTILVSGLGTAALAGVGSGQQIMFFVMSALSALSVGSSILVAQAVGARDVKRAGRLARQSLLWSVIFSVPLALIGVALSHPVMGLFGLAPEVAEIGAAYMSVTMGTVVVLVALVIGGGVLRGAGDSRTPMIVTTIANIVNIGLAYGLIYGHFGLPALGAVGSAWATFMARGLALVLLIIVLWKGRKGVTIRGEGSWRPDFSVARHVLSLGLPASVEQVLSSTGFLVLTAVVAHLGTNTLAAQRISMTALSFSFLPGFGFAMAGTALVGQSIGARRPDIGGSVAKIATTWAVLWMGTFGALMFIFATPIMGFFTSDPVVTQIGADGLRIVAISQPLWAIGMVQSGALRGTGDTRFPSVMGAIGTWSAVLLAWLFSRLPGAGLPAVWMAFVVTTPVTSFLTWRRLRSSVARLTEESHVVIRA
jgi:multidrug resistance protein, MATE family